MTEATIWAAGSHHGTALRLGKVEDTRTRCCRMPGSGVGLLVAGGDEPREGWGCPVDEAAAAPPGAADDAVGEVLGKSEGGAPAMMWLPLLVLSRLGAAAVAIAARRDVGDRIGTPFVFTSVYSNAACAYACPFLFARWCRVRRTR